MIEGMIIGLIVVACMYLPLRGKTLESLNPKQRMKLDKQFAVYQHSKKGRQTPEMTVGEYLPILAKKGLNSLIAALIILPIYVLLIMVMLSGAMA